MGQGLQAQLLVVKGFQYFVHFTKNASMRAAFATPNFFDFFHHTT